MLHNFLLLKTKYSANILQTVKQKRLQSLETLTNISDLDWIQTSNLLSRNQVRYSVAPRGLFLWVQI